MNVTVTVIRSPGSLLNKAMLLTGVRRAVRDLVSEGQRFMAEYPPEAPGQRYRRTGTLKRSWSSEVRESGDKTEGIVGSNANIAPYNTKVQGGGGEQGPYFRGMWRNVDDLVKKAEGELPKRLQAEIDRAAG